ncbi:MAG: hypothetical protein ACI32F_08090 [Allobaculum sp.]
MNMKKPLAALLAGLMLAGCSGTAATTVTDGSETLMTIGDKTYTFNDEYQCLKDSSAGASAVIFLANQPIYDAEVGRTDEILEEAQKRLEDYSSSEGFEEQIKSIGFADNQDYLERALIPSVQSSYLFEKYLTDNKDAIIEEYDPVLVSIIETDSEDNANKALQALKDGQDAGKVSAQYASEDATYKGTEQIILATDTTLPTTLLNAILDAGKDGVLDQVFTNDTSTDDKIYYVANVVSTDYDANLSKIKSALMSNQTVQTEMQIYYFKKYDFEVHDQAVYDYYKGMNPEYLVNRPELYEKALEEASQSSTAY